MHWLKGVSLGVIGLGLILSTPSQGQAIDFKVKGQWQINFGVSNVPDGRSRGSDSFMANQRFRTTIEARASENVSATIGFTMPNNTANQAWGRAGSSMGADGVDVGVWQAYIDWNIPNTQIATRMGIQYLIMPGFVTGSNPVFSRNMPGISMHAPVWSNKEWNVGATFFWARPYNDNYSDPDETRSKTLDNLDVFALSVPITTQGLKINPWVIGALIGQNSLKSLPSGGPGAMYAPRGGLTPILGSGGTFASTFDKGRRWHTDTDWGGGGWGGLTAEIKTFAPWEFAIEGAYDEVDMGEIKHYTQFGDKKGRTFDLHRHGWYVGARVDYHFDWGTLGALGWYSSGDDDNPYNGSERMPMFNSQWPVTPLGFGGCYTDLSPWKVLGHGGGCGLTGGVAYLKNVSFIDRLKHTLKVGYFQGTNSPEMPRKANMTHYPTFADGPMAYLTTTDHAWDFSLSNTYKMYENLEINLEGSYVNLFLKNDTWKGVEDSQHKDNWIVSMTFNYTF